MIAKPAAFEANCAGAVFSADRTRRYRLTRSWEPIAGQDEKSLGFVMLNPSKAGALEDDATVRKCMGFARRWGFTEIVVTNLIPLIATDPYSLTAWGELDPENNAHLRGALDYCDTTVVAWGSISKALARYVGLSKHLDNFREMSEGYRLSCIGFTQKADPLHPSRAPYTTEALDWEWPDPPRALDAGELPR
jgi:hypothetical protein